MAVVPVGEGATKLDVAEVVIPDELGDLCLPWDADGGIGEGAEAESHARALASGDTSEAQGRISGDGTGWWWSKCGFFDAGFPPGRHKAWEVFRIGEEGKDKFEGEGKPVLGVERVAHRDSFVIRGWRDDQKCSEGASGETPSCDAVM